MNRTPLFLFAAMAMSLITPVHALTRAQALQLLGEHVLKPSDSDELICAWMTPAPLAGGTMTTLDGDVSVEIGSLGGAQWFAYVDLEPCAFLEHDVLYVFIEDAATPDGVVPTVVAADNWPALNGVEIEDGGVIGGQRIHVYAGLPRGEAVDSGSDPGAPAADYGDAPDGQLAYPGTLGKFPTLFSTTNGNAGAPGGHALLLGFEMLGDTVSQEEGALDSTDSDGETNLVDADKDDRIFWSWDRNTTPPTSHIIYDVTISAGATLFTPRWVNVLVDLDQSGDWRNTATTTEWVTVNQVFIPPAIGTYTLMTPPFFWEGTGNPNGPTLAWTRILLHADEELDPGDFGVAGWDGSGAFSAGEIEDFKLYRKCCPGVGCPPPPGGGDDDDDDDDDEDDVPPDTPPPGPQIGWDGSSVKYHALVVQGVDHGSDKAAREAADQMQRLLGTQGYKTTRLSGNSKKSGSLANEANIKKWICDLLPNLACQDRVLIYFIGHGKKATPGGQIRLRKKKSGDPGTYTGSELAAALAKIPSCAGEACDVKGKCCNVTVIMESCYAGQWLAGLSGPGRNIVTTSEADTPSYFGTDGTGGAYSDSYADCAKPANRAAVDGVLAGESADGDVEPNELHAWATVVIGDPYGKRQKPQTTDMTCPCVCPPFIWDCICDAGGVVKFFPGEWFSDGGLLGVSFEAFPDGIIVPDENPIYDHLDLLVPPEEWGWGAEFPGFHGQMILQVQVIGISPETSEIMIPLFDFSPTAEPPGAGPFFLNLQIDLEIDQFQIGAEFGDPLVGPWSQFEQIVQDNPDLEPIPAYRANRPPAAEKIPVEIVLMELATPAGLPDWVNLQWEARSGAEYMIDAAFGDLNFVPVGGPIDNNAYTLPFDDLVPAAFFRVRAQPLGTGPTTGP